MRLWRMKSHSIIASWDAALLTAEQREAVDEFQNVVDNLIMENE